MLAIMFLTSSFRLNLQTSLTQFIFPVAANDLTFSLIHILLQVVLRTSVTLYETASPCLGQSLGRQLPCLLIEDIIQMKLQKRDSYETHSWGADRHCPCVHDWCHGMVISFNWGEAFLLCLKAQMFINYIITSSSWQGNFTSRVLAGLVLRPQ